MTEPSRVLEVIYKAIDESNEQLSADKRLLKLPGTILLGPGSVLDSLGFVNLIVAVEQNVDEEFGTSLTLANDRAFSMTHSPFRTVEGLTSYIIVLLKDAAK
jgi:acyl carrier protein